jgi:arylsulfatase
MRFLACLIALATVSLAKGGPPVVVLIVGDDLGYAELGCYGQKIIQTPELDRMAREGTRFTAYRSGSPVCAPSRCCLLTGRHSGHAAIRNNREIKPTGQEPLPEGIETIANHFKRKGYATAAAGKWGLGTNENAGDPLKRGFDHFTGYHCQRHAHNHFPSFLFVDGAKVPQPGNTDGDTGATWSQDVFEKQALDWLDQHKEKPLFLFLPVIVPHVALQAPEDAIAPYLGKFDDPPYPGNKGYRKHPRPRAAYAAMISRFDRMVGRVIDRLRRQGRENDALVMVTSDNGPTHDGVGGADCEFFKSSGGLRGMKGSVYEGGIRVPLLAWGPGRVRAGAVADIDCYAPDIFATLAQAAGIRVDGTDGISLMPTLTGQGRQPRHDVMYWEFPGYGGQQAILAGGLKLVRTKLASKAPKTELFDLEKDPGEKDDLAASRPNDVERLLKLAASQRVPSELFKFPALDNQRN